MKTSKSQMEILKLDLQTSYDLAESIYEKTMGDWIYGIDPENMLLLKQIWKKADGSYSLNSLGHAIRQGKKIKGYFDMEPISEVFGWAEAKLEALRADMVFNREIKPLLD